MPDATHPATSHLLVQQNHFADIRQMAVALSIVDTVAHHELIRHLETLVITNLAPILEHSMAEHFPIPEEAPVIRIVLPSKVYGLYIIITLINY